MCKAQGQYCDNVKFSVDMRTHLLSYNYHVQPMLMYRTPPAHYDNLVSGLCRKVLHALNERDHLHGNSYCKQFILAPYSDHCTAYIVALATACNLSHQMGMLLHMTCCHMLLTASCMAKILALEMLFRILGR